MAEASRLLLLFVVFFSLALVGIEGDAGVKGDHAEPEEPLISELEASMTSEFEEPLISELEASLASESNEPLASESNEPLASELEASLASESNEPLASELEASLASELEASLASESNEPLASELEASLASESNEPLASELEGSPTSESEETPTSAVEELKLKIATLESRIAKANLQLEAKDETLMHFENAIQEKTEIIDSLEAEIQSLQKNATKELEKQIVKLKGDIQAQVNKRDAFEARAVEAEKKVEELNLMLESLQKTNDEQKKRIKKTQLALKEAEEELMKVMLEASSKRKELTEIHGAWLPPWLSAHLGHCQATAAAHWHEHGKPSYDAFLQKVLDVLTKARKKVDPHLETVKEKWIPTLKGHCVRVRTSAEPCVQLMTTKAFEVYEMSVVTLKLHVVRVQDIADPYFQEVKKFSKPYIDHVAMIMKPHVQKVQTVLKPYTEQVVYASGKFLKPARTHHYQSKDEVPKHM